MNKLSIKATGSVSPGAFICFLAIVLIHSCNITEKQNEPGPGPPFIWENANVYFLLTDRFLNGDPSNDVNFQRSEPTAKLRGFEGGDLRGVIRKLEEGYFERLGITAIWLTPWFEQIHGSTNEGTGNTYGYHGYWARDWTRMDPNFGTEEELSELVDLAHSRGIRIIMDVVVNHTGPVTEKDPVWPVEWVRTSPTCTYRDYESTVTCTLVENLPDIRTEVLDSVPLPTVLLQKWEQEGRLQEELQELELFFGRTGFPRAPRYYLIKWLTDFVRAHGIDGFRLDTAKHTEEEVWGELWDEAQLALEDWRRQHPEKTLDDNEFYMVGEVYGYGISGGRYYDYGDRQVDFFAHSVKSLINFEFKSNAGDSYEALFSSYSLALDGPLKGKSVLNYLSSHDDGDPFDPGRTKPLEAGTRLLLSPGASQIYYGDESCRDLVIGGTMGDATLRGMMNWEEIEENVEKNGIAVGEVLDHYGRLGRFRRDHPAVGAGIHRMISEDPYVFTRELNMEAYTDRVMVAMDLGAGKKTLPAGELFPDRTRLHDFYSGQDVMVKNGKVVLDSEYGMVLLGLKQD
jgi:alpha-amylase